jgi:hypothetical protein
MLDTSRQLHFTHALEHFAGKLNELLSSARRQQSTLPPELLDEIAYTTGELTIVLMNHEKYQEEGLIRDVLLLAQTLRHHLRSKQLRGEQVVQAFSPFTEKIDLLITSRRKHAA